MNKNTTINNIMTILSENTGDYTDSLNNNYKTAQCKLLVYELNQLLNKNNQTICKKIDPKNIISKGTNGTIYLNNDGTVYKKSLIFNKLLSVMSLCDMYADDLVSSFMFIIEIPKTIEKIKLRLVNSILINHFNLPVKCNLCLCKDKLH